MAKGRPGGYGRNAGETRLAGGGACLKTGHAQYLVVDFGTGGNNHGMHYVIAAIIGLAGGVASGLFGIGGGIVMVPAMVYFLGMNVKTAVGTSLAVIIPTAISGCYKHQQLGNIDWRMAAALVPLAIAGGYLGAALTQDLPAATLKRMFGGLMILAGLKLMLGK